VVVVQHASILILKTERGAPHANIVSASDAIWWTIVTVTTVGHDDYYPVTNSGRLVGVVTMIVGVGPFGVLTGYLTNALLSPESEQTRAEHPPQGESTQPSVRSPNSRGLARWWMI
jgi:voltage-gated potassium channel